MLRRTVLAAAIGLGAVAGKPNETWVITNFQVLSIDGKKESNLSFNINEQFSCFNSLGTAAFGTLANHSDLCYNSDHGYLFSTVPTPATPPTTAPWYSARLQIGWAYGDDYYEGDYNFTDNQFRRCNSGPTCPLCLSTAYAGSDTFNITAVWVPPKSQGRIEDPIGSW